MVLIRTHSKYTPNRILVNFRQKQVNALVHIRMFQEIPLIRHLILTSVSEKNILTSIFICLFYVYSN